jgi:hypothetical protein
MHLHLLTEAEAAVQIGITLDALRRARRCGAGPAWVNVSLGSKRPVPRYAESDLRAWLAERTQGAK